MRIVADASPLIFLAKIRHLKLVSDLWGQDILVPRSVADEVLSTEADPLELELLKVFLRQCHIESVREPRQFAVAMSRADNEVLTLAIRKCAGLLVSDDKMTRRMAEAFGVRPMGTLGILLKAMQQNLISPVKPRTLLDELIELHAFRIGIKVYQLAIHTIDEASQQ